MVFKPLVFWFLISNQFLVFLIFSLLTLAKLRPHLTHYSLPMHSHSDVEERDLGPPMTLYIKLVH